MTDVPRSRRATPACGPIAPLSWQASRPNKCNSMATTRRPCCGWLRPRRDRYILGMSAKGLKRTQGLMRSSFSSEGFALAIRE